MSLCAVARLGQDVRVHTVNLHGGRVWTRAAKLHANVGIHALAQSLEFRPQSGRRRARQLKRVPDAGLWSPEEIEVKIF
jgi:hypothetical protein